MWKRLALSAVLLAVAASQTIPQTSNPEINLLISKAPANVETKRYKGYVPPRFNGITLKSFYLPMRDGVKIAIEPLNRFETSAVKLSQGRAW